MVVMSMCLYCRLISAVKMRQFEHEQLEQQRQACQLTAEVQPLWGSGADSGASKKRDGESKVVTVQPEPEQQPAQDPALAAAVAEEEQARAAAIERSGPSRRGAMLCAARNLRNKGG